MTVEVRPVGRDTRLRDGYVDVSWRVYQNDPYWVPPLKADLKKTMDPRANPFFRHAEVEHFVALAPGGHVIGRVAATLYPAYNERYGGQAGFFGFFESPPDQAVADALLNTVETWARNHSLQTVVGPYNYCSTQEMGLLIDGYETAPALFQTHNPPYYRELLERHGYTPEFCMTTYRWSVHHSGGGFAQELARGDAAMQAASLTVRSIDINHFDREVETLRGLFNRSFAQNHAVLPVEADVFAFQAAALKPFVDRRLVRLIERGGVPVAFAMLAPNMNEVLKDLNGRVGAREVVELLTGRLLRRVRSAVVLLMGAEPELNGLGLGRVLAAEIWRSVCDTQYQTVHTTWIHEHNWASLALVGRWRAVPVKRYAIYARTVR